LQERHAQLLLARQRPSQVATQAPAQLVLAEGTATSLTICEDCAVLVSDRA